MHGVCSGDQVLGTRVPGDVNGLRGSSGGAAGLTAELSQALIPSFCRFWDLNSGLWGREHLSLRRHHRPAE